MRKLIFGALLFLSSVAHGAFKTDWLQNTSSSFTVHGTTYNWQAGAGSSGQVLTTNGGNPPILTFETPSGGGGGSPGGVNDGDIQYKSGSSFAGSKYFNFNNSTNKLSLSNEITGFFAESSTFTITPSANSFGPSTTILSESNVASHGLLIKTQDPSSSYSSFSIFPTNANGRIFRLDNDSFLVPQLDISNAGYSVIRSSGNHDAQTPASVSATLGVVKMYDQTGKVFYVGIDGNGGLTDLFEVNTSTIIASLPLQLPLLDCSTFINGGKLTTDSLGNVTCGDDISGGGGGGTTIWVKEDGSAVDNSVSTMNFTNGINVTSSPSGQANIAIDYSSVASRGDVIFNQNYLQSGATFYVSSGTVSGTMYAQTFSGAFSGSGASIININPANLSAGNIPSNVMASSFPTVNANVGSFTNMNATVDAYGRITTASNGTAGGGGGGGNPIEVFNNFDGTRSSPTYSISSSDAFRGTVSGSTYTFRINFSSVASRSDLLDYITISTGTNGAGQLVRLNGSTQLPAVSGVNLTNLSSSAIDSSSVTKQGNSFNGASQLVQTTSSGLVPNANIDGSSITKQGLLVAGSNITLTPGAGSLTIASTGGGSGSSIYPATATAIFPYGLRTSTIEVTGAGNSYIDTSTNEFLGFVINGTTHYMFKSSMTVNGNFVLTEANRISLSTGVTGSLPLTSLAAGTLASNIIASSASATMLVSSFPVVNANVGSFTNVNLTVDAYGRITAASNGSAGGGGGGRPLEVFSNFDGVQSSPTYSIALGDAIKMSVSGSTAVVSVDFSSVTAYGPNIPASAISAGSLGSSVLASSISVSGFYNNSQIRSNLGLGVGVDVQAFDSDLSDLADGSLTGTKVGFADTDNNFTATDVQSAIEELDNVNGSGPNAADGKVDWSQLVSVPAGFADGTDDGAGGGGTADSFGSHTATKTVNMSAYGIDNIGSSSSTFGSAGNLTVNSTFTTTGGFASYTSSAEVRGSQFSIIDMGFNIPQVVVTSSQTLVSTHTVVLSSGGLHAPITLTLPSAASSFDGKIMIIEKIDLSTHPVTITADGTDRIESTTTFKLFSPGQAIRLRNNVASQQWFVDHYDANPPSLGEKSDNGAATVFTANQAHCQSIYVPVPVTAKGIGFNVTTTSASGRTDIGLYNSVGQRLGSSGNQPSYQAAAGAKLLNFQVSGSTVPIFLTPGNYYGCIAVNNAIVTIGNAGTKGRLGAHTFTTSFPLPTTLSFPGTASQTNRALNLILWNNGGGVDTQ